MIAATIVHLAQYEAGTTSGNILDAAICILLLSILPALAIFTHLLTRPQPTPKPAAFNRYSYSDDTDDFD